MQFALLGSSWPGLHIIYGRIAKSAASYRKLQSRNMIVTFSFKAEVEIWLFLTCAMKFVQYNAY